MWKFFDECGQTGNVITCVAWLLIFSSPSGFFELSLYVSYMAFMLYVVSIPLHIARRVFVTAK